MKLDAITFALAVTCVPTFAMLVGSFALTQLDVSPTTGATLQVWARPRMPARQRGLSERICVRDPLGEGPLDGEPLAFALCVHRAIPSLSVQ